VPHQIIRVGLFIGRRVADAVIDVSDWNAPEPARTALAYDAWFDRAKFSVRENAIPGALPRPLPPRLRVGRMGDHPNWRHRVPWEFTGVQRSSKLQPGYR
jgi:hypothetical protein